MNEKLILATILVICGYGSAAHGQNVLGEERPPFERPNFYRSLSLAPASDESGGGGGGSKSKEAGGEDDKQADLAQQLQNPIADLISVPIQNNWDFGVGPANAMEYEVKIQPVIPVSISSNYNVIVRTILPVIYAESPIPGDDVHANPPFPGGATQGGLGDTTQSFFLSPKKPIGGWIVGAGPVLYYPTATASVLGSGKWGAGPTVVALRQDHGWTYGILANQIWSFAGWGDQNISSTFLQPFLSFTTKKKTTFSVDTESTYDWEQSQWKVPVNFQVQQLVKIGKLPVAFQVGYRYYAKKPDGGPDWGLRFTVTFLFPKSKK